MTLRRRLALLAVAALAASAGCLTAAPPPAEGVAPGAAAPPAGGAGTLVERELASAQIALGPADAGPLATSGALEVEVPEGVEDLRIEGLVEGPTVNLVVLGPGACSEGVGSGLSTQTSAEIGRTCGPVPAGTHTVTVAHDTGSAVVTLAVVAAVREPSTAA